MLIVVTIGHARLYSPVGIKSAGSDLAPETVVRLEQRRSTRTFLFQEVRSHEAPWSAADDRDSGHTIAPAVC